MSQSGPRVIIIGAGVGGLTLAIALKRKLGFENYTIFEKASSVGGTWRDNVYPGCSSDVPAHFYSISTDLKSDWTCTHPFQPELESYLQQVSKQNDIQSRTRFGINVLKATWDDTRHLYTVLYEDVKTKEQSVAEAEVVVSAIGLLENPNYPKIDGLSSFKGELFHSSRWRKDVDLRGKRVAVIGNGASATQLVPAIAKTEGIKVTQFCRTANWFFPPIREWYSPLNKWMFKYVPFFQRLVRLEMFLRADMLYLTVFKWSLTRAFFENSMNRYRQLNAPAKDLKQLTPNYPLGCKRVLFDADYYPTLHRDNVELNWDGISSITENGIVTKTGDSLPFDVIIIATGFTPDKFTLAVEGIDGKSIQEYHESNGGPIAYLGTSTPGFPNFYTIAGANTATGHTSVIFFEEVQSNYIVQLIKPILQRKYSVVDVTTSATDVYNAKIQDRLDRGVFGGCNSWYRVGLKGKITAMFPGSGVSFWWWLRRPVWRDYKVTKYIATADK